MRTKINYYVEFHGLSMTIDNYLAKWATWGGHELKHLPFKRDTRYWNNSPWSDEPYKCWACFRNTGRSGDICVGVFEIWKRRDGMGGSCYKFDSLEDYEAYNPSQEMPYNIKHEIGLGNKNF